MSYRPKRIAPPHIIADAASVLLAQIEASQRISDKDKDRWYTAVKKAFEQLLDGAIWRRDGASIVFASRSRPRADPPVEHRVNGRCDCEAASDTRRSPAGEICWHRPAARMIALIEEAERHEMQAPSAQEEPAYRCFHCGSPMDAGMTPAGEDCFQCLNPKCAWTVHAEAVEAFA